MEPAAEGGKRGDMCVEESVEIDRPVEEVFSYVSTVENLLEWASPHRGTQGYAGATQGRRRAFTAVRRQVSGSSI
jgi:uncharacterized protein YndB with AHSA1/START domain